MIKKLFIIFIFIASVLYADHNQTQVKLTQDEIIKIELIKEKIEAIDLALKNNIWLIGYQNYITYLGLIEELNIVDKEVKRLSRKRDKNSKLKYKEFLKEQDRLEKQIELLREYKNSPFVKIVKPDELDKKPEVVNPFSIISAFSYIKQIETERENYKNRIDSLDNLIMNLKDKSDLLKQIDILHKDEEIEKRLFVVNQDILEFNRAHDLAETTFAVYSKKVDRVRLEVTEDITAQMKRAFDIALFIIVVIVISLIFKLIIKKYITDNERFYMANKAINLINFTLIVLILLFAYIENVSYFVTVLGFASAGIAIAMKDWFMSILGWMVIVFGGSFHVGDRVKVQKDGLPYVGDIIDISLLRMTILEDITLTSYLQNRRSGRVVFIPNNYVFTTLISNYTHGTLKTVWDGIDLTITFDSNHKKAMYIIKEITKKYSKGYTDIARRSLNQLRSQYSLKNTNVEPRIYSFLEPHGLTISTWYMTNSYAALTLRSTISYEIVEAINKEKDIQIAYPTQTIDVRRTGKNLPSDIDINKDVLY
ncbi:mechanosensitive ion channel family protein [Sulfurospirillum arcachonense]|uniref:mechanosensitive ion channel family protein n=1 Tax=Sulfurospirillum arcachonense TaxID=57666 RepID=UPI0004B94F7D|nr:mechanosensitive ion channel domain-containing protein [Sulfurospirillum arcachonense]